MPELAGGTLLAVGIWVTVDGSSFLKLLGPFRVEALLFVNVGYFCIAMGALLVLLSVLGCCGAHKESKCLLITFFSILMLIFIAEVAAAVVALVYSSVAEDVLISKVKPTLLDHYGKDPKVTKVWDAMMSQSKCCGFSNYTDFSNYSQNGDSYPSACCSAHNATCSQEAAYQSNVKGCFELLSVIKKDANIVGGIAAGVCALEVAAMGVSMYLYCQLDKTTR
ncbi:tetraspanin-1 isoform X2 [Conger conger]|uniref:tetraspanin-1 isoform X2 n=1 Tax=Conger conger TaxID=82655 RepID=UPI002A599CDD|nr:tetraspanin-1 isoform X2 [Conger conger]